MSTTVALAVIVDEQQRVLITQRSLHVPHGGCWEFPGGKLEVDESSENALIREVKEELGLDVSQYQFLDEVHHQYSNKTLKLIIFLVTGFSGEPICLEGQLAMKWIHLNELNPSDFPEANWQVIKVVSHYFSTLARL
jgi:8-oxo-dGTP diphosphatase